MKPLFVGMGEALWDVLPEGRQIGGAPANFAFHAGQLGFPSVAVSAVGNDALGDEIMEIFTDKGLQYLLERVGYPTGTVQVTLDADGIPNYEIREGVAWDNIPLTDSLHSLAERTGVFCFGTLAQRNAVSRASIRHFLGHMPDSGLKVFDINLRQHFYDREVIVSSLEACNVLKINDDEYERLRPMLALEGMSLEADCWELLRRFCLRGLVLTCGAAGSHIFTQSEHSYLETPRVRVADTVGAGDSFTAAYCAAVLAGKSTREAHRLAVDLAAYVCTQHGAMPEVPEELKNRLN